MNKLHPCEIISPLLLQKLKDDARQSPRLRAALPIHKDSSDPVQRVLMAANPDTYVGPHLHPDKAWEMVILLEGALDIILFSQEGIVKERISLTEEGNRIFEYPANQFHAAVILKPDTIVFETKQGPYIEKQAKELPDWAPEEFSDLATAYNSGMKSVQVGESVVEHKTV